MEFIKLFPTVIGKANINRSFTEEEKEFFRKSFEEKERMLNIGNECSTDTYVLENQALFNLKNDIQTALDNYLEVVVKPKYKVRLQITQSWLNWTKYNEFHHAHKHANSYLSGVFYYNATNEDSITFENDMYMQIHIHSENVDELNSVKWNCTTNTGDIVLFPSRLVHSVEKRLVEDGVRTSLAFNVIPLGELGDRDSLTQLLLE